MKRAKKTGRRFEFDLHIYAFDEVVASGRGFTTLRDAIKAARAAVEHLSPEQREQCWDAEGYNENQIDIGSQRRGCLQPQLVG